MEKVNYFLYEVWTNAGGVVQIGDATQNTPLGSGVLLLKPYLFDFDISIIAQI